MEFATLRLQRDGSVLHVTLDNPPRNFLDGQTLSDLGALLRSLARDRSIGAVVLPGTPEDVYITHFDVSELPSEADAARIVTPDST